MVRDRLVREKEALRRSMRQRLEAVDPAADRETARRLADRVLDSAEVARAERVFACLSFGTEVDTWALVDRLLDRGCEIVAPRSVWSTRTMTLHPYPCELETLRFGLRQPAASARQLDPSSIDEMVDVALVLGLGFDRRGYRLGFGAGFFDRFLAGRRFPTLGLAREIQVLDRMPVASHDVPMSAVITEAGRIDPP